MSTARRANTVAWAVCACFALIAVVGGAAIALARSSGIQANASTLGVPMSAQTPTPASSQPVPSLRRLTPPDVIVTMRQPASPKAIRALQSRSGVRQVSLLDRGTIRLHGSRLRVLGVPLSTIRGFTPALTASSDALWSSVARGEVTVAYAYRHEFRGRLGSTVNATGMRGRVDALRIGAFATIGLAGAQAMVSDQAGRALGLGPRREVLVAAPAISLDELTADVHKALGADAHIDVTRAAPVNQSLSSSYALSTIPASYLDLYRRAAVTCPGLPWTVLAGIGTVETGNGRDVHESTAGAEGPMQFMPSTWAMYGYDADGDGKADINDPTDAVFSAARYLCAAGAGRGGQSLNDAIFSYNHAWWYVREVIEIANQYA